MGGLLPPFFCKSASLKALTATVKPGQDVPLSPLPGQPALLYQANDLGLTRASFERRGHRFKETPARMRHKKRCRMRKHARRPLSRMVMTSEGSYDHEHKVGRGGGGGRGSLQEHLRKISKLLKWQPRNGVRGDWSIVQLIEEARVAYCRGRDDRKRRRAVEKKKMKGKNGRSH